MQNNFSINNRRIRSTIMLPSMIILIIQLCSCSPVVDTLNSSAVSPKGDYVARFIHRDVGATAPTASIVTLCEVSNESSDVLKQRILSINGKVNVEIKWTDEYELVITIRCREGDEKEFIKKKNYKNVKIRYEYDPSL